MPFDFNGHDEKLVFLIVWVGRIVDGPRRIVIDADPGIGFFEVLEDFAISVVAGESVCGGTCFFFH